eukprot:6209961-Prymnesium_polylepis.1
MVGSKRDPPSDLLDSARVTARALQQSQLARTGHCQIVGDCVQSSGYPNDNDNNDWCEISGVPTTPIHVNVVAFNVEGSSCRFDYSLDPPLRNLHIRIQRPRAPSSENEK